MSRFFSIQAMAAAIATCLLLASATGVAADTCAAETADLMAIGSDVVVRIEAPKGGTALEPVHISWQAKTHAPAKVPVFIAIAIPGEVRFQAQLPASSNSKENEGDLPGFLALTPETRGPLGLEFGKGTTRALVPLHQAGAKLSGEFDVHGLSAGEVTIAAAVVARTSCGERVISAKFDRTLTLVPGAPEIVVQDPYDIDQPKQVIISNNGRYRAHIFDNHYRVYDVKTGAKLVDRAGKQVNFSPTGRFVVANTVSSGLKEGVIVTPVDESYEVIDVVFGEVLATLKGPFIGFAEGDAFVIDGHPQWGVLTVRATLLTTPKNDKTSESEDDPLSFWHDVSCHSCTSWETSTLAIDLDNGILTFGSSLLPKSPEVFELASGSSVECASPDCLTSIQNAYAIVPAVALKGWSSRAPIRFSHVYDPDSSPNGKKFAHEAWVESAKRLKPQLLLHKTVDPKAVQAGPSAIEATLVVRGDWRPRLDHDVAQDATTRLVRELSRLGLLASAPLDVEIVPFVNGITSPERSARYDDASKDVQSKIDEEISERTRKLEQKIGEDIPSAVPMLGPAPIGPNKSTFYLDLDRELEGSWRWLVKGRPLWLLQRQAGDEGSIFLLEGDAPSGPKTGGRVVNLGRSLELFLGGPARGDRPSNPVQTEHLPRSLPRIGIGGGRQHRGLRSRDGQGAAYLGGCSTTRSDLRRGPIRRYTPPDPGMFRRTVLHFRGGLWAPSAVGADGGR